MQDLWRTAVDVFVSVIPVVAFMIILHAVVLRAPIEDMRQVLVGVVLTVIGLIAFTQGLRMGLLPLGQSVGQNLPNTGSLWVVLIVGFAMGYGVTLAEPALHALGIQVEEFSAGLLSRRLVIHAVAFGVGLGILLGLLKIVLKIPLLYMLIPAYAVAAILALVAPRSIVGAAFDSGGVTTGPVTVPIIVALGVGMASALGGRDPLQDGFGLIALASAGPIVSVLLLSVIVGYR